MTLPWQRSHRFSLVAAIGLAFVTAPSTTRAAFLSDLLQPGATLTSGPLSFSNFQYDVIPAGSVPPATEVTVTPTADAYGNSGISIQGAFNATPPNTPAITGFELSYDVTVTQPNAGIFIFYQTGDPMLSDPAKLGVAELSQTPSIPPNFLVGPSSLYALNFSGMFRSQSASRSDLGIANAHPFFHIDDSASFTAGTGRSSDPPSQIAIPSISFFNQTFAVVPEPASLITLALGWLAIGLAFACRGRAALVVLGC